MTWQPAAGEDRDERPPRAVERGALNIPPPVPLARPGAAARVERPWRGILFAGGGHLLVAGAVLMLVKLHMPASPPDGPVISVLVETLRQGDMAASVAQPDAASPLPAPPQPLAPVGSAEAVFPLPPPALVQKRQSLSVLVQGAKELGQENGSELVVANRPATVDAGNAVPVYSQLSRALGEQGKVNLSVLVLPGGRPGRVTVLRSSGYARLDDAARRAVLRWHFRPALRNGVPVASVISYWFRFELQ